MHFALPFRRHSASTGVLILWAALAVLGTAYLLQLGKKPLAHTDECLTADRSQEMLITRSYLTVWQDFEPNFNKPPLHYYLTAAFLAAFPDQEFAVRLASCLFGLGCALLAGLLVSYFYPDSRYLPAIAASFILLSPLFAHSARQGHLDTGFTFWGLLGICGVLWALKKPSAWAWAGWAVGLGTLHKFPLALPWIAVALWVFRRELPADWRQSLPFRQAVLLAAGLALAWPLLQWIQYGSHFMDEFFMDQILGRVVNPEHRLAKSDPTFYFGRLDAKWPLMGLLAVPLLVGGLLPRRLSREQHPLRPCFFFSLLGLGYLLAILAMSGKSVRYLVPLVPCLSLAATFLFYQLSGRREWVVLLAFLLFQGIGAFRLTKEWNGPPNEIPHLVDLSRDLGRHWQPGEEVLLYNGRGMYSSLITFYSAIPKRMHVQLTPKTNFNGITSPTFLSLGHLKTMEEIRDKWKVQPEVLERRKDLAIWRTATPPPTALPEETPAGGSPPDQASPK